LIVVCETKAGEFWFGTSAGIIHVQPGIENIENHGADLGLDFERVTAIAELADGKLWCGTTSHAYEFSNGRWQRRLRTPDRVTGIISAAGSVWVGTPARLYRWLEGSWIEHTGNEGVLGNGVYALKLSPNHKLLAGTSRGIITFHPDADTDPPRTWSPVLPDTRTPSTLEPTTVVFRGNDKWDYTMPTDLLFSYKLDEAPWTPYSNITSRVFQNLSSGTHVVEVRAMDRNGNQSSIPSRIEFAVIVPWFQDPRLLVVMVLALFFSLIFAAYAVLKHFELKRSYAEVEQIVRQRTGELQKANQELLHSQKMRAIGTMAAGIAHDFNNILSIIKGSAQIIERNVDDRDKIKTRVNRIQTVVEQGTSIVKALLGLGRMNEQDLSPCNLGTLLKEIRKLLADRFSTDVRFEVDVENTLAEPICSREVLQQMLLNFILNAVEAMGGKGLVRLTAREVTALPPDIVLEPSVAESYVIVSVVDLGSGIAPENLPRIFEPFFTTKGFSSRRGTGLGLSMVYELAKGLGYGVAVKSVVGEGSSFSIVLPFKPAREEAEPGNPSVTSPSSSTECRRK
jgi:signal transduction histidine kinase